MAKVKRKQWFVDPRMQGALVWRFVAYWFLCLLALVVMLFCWRVYVGPPHPFLAHMQQIWLQFGPAAVGAMLLLPIVLMDVVRVSNRLCGPIVRLRHGLRQLADDEVVEPLECRAGDYCDELLADFNALAQRRQNHPPAGGELAAASETKTENYAAVN